MVFDDDNMPLYLTPEEYLDSPMPYIDEGDTEAVADEMKERRRMIDTFIRIYEDGKLYTDVQIRPLTKEELRGNK